MPHATMLPPAPGESASAVKAQMNELISLMDRILLMKGATITRRGGLRAPGIVPPPSKDDVPVALHLFADVSIASHLCDSDLLSFEEICARATVLMARPVVTNAASAHLCGEFAKECDSDFERAIFANYKIPDQVCQLRLRRQRTREPEVQLFTLIVITSISPCGYPQSYSTTLHPIEVSWADFQVALTNASVCWQTYHAQLATGYTTEHGMWFWQASRQGREIDKLKPMASPDELQRMKAELRVPDTLILVWHERILDLSHRLRAEAEALTKQHDLQLRETEKHPLEEELLPYEAFRIQGMDEMWAQVRQIQDEAEERENSEIIGRFMEYDRVNPLFPETGE